MVDSSSSFLWKEVRLQDHKNRQNSIPNEDEWSLSQWQEKQEEVSNVSRQAYQWAIEKGVAREIARAVLPEGLTPCI
jgi:thymidylate synthase (FAD)